MLRFPTPVPRIKFCSMDADILLSSDQLFETFPVHCINFLIPSSNTYKQAFEDLLISDENVYFMVKDVAAKSLIEKTFLEQFMKSGSLLATSHDAKAEAENFLAIAPSGKLVLSLETSIAQCLALQKENPNKKKKRKKAFETIIIDIACPAFSPGKKLYEFVSFELSKIEHIKFTLLMKWKPYGNVCPQSLKAYFESQNVKCIACKPNQKYSSKFSVLAPTLSSDMSTTSIHDILEWVGMQICGIEYSDIENEYVSKLFAPEHSKTLTRLHKCTFEGFYSKSEVVPVIKEIRKLFETDHTLPYIVICLSGFQESYVADSGFQCFSSADKLICVIAFPSSSYWVITLNAR